MNQKYMVQKEDRPSAAVIGIAGIIAWPLWFGMIVGIFLFIEEGLGFKVSANGNETLSKVIAFSIISAGFWVWGLIANWCWKFTKKCTERIQATAHGQHYVFVHKALRDLFFDQPENIVAILRADGASDALLDLWYRVGKEVEDSSLSSPDGLDCEVRTLDNDTVAVLITFPQPQRICEGYFAGMVYRPTSGQREGTARFMVLERGVRGARLCEWEDAETRSNMEYCGEAELESFFEAVREIVSCDSVI